MDGREPRGIMVGDCIVPLDGPARCGGREGGREVDVVWLDGYYVVGDWLCEERSGFCIRVPRLVLALRRLERRVGVVRARLVY
jgi:hypothetical protein